MNYLVFFTGLCSQQFGGELEGEELITYALAKTEMADVGELPEVERGLVLLLMAPLVLAQ